MTVRTPQTTQRATRERGEFAGLRFAAYARKSTEDARHEDHRSTARQVEQARAYVERRGGVVLPDHIYVDEDTSGAEFKARPGLLRLLNALENGRPFNALVMSDDDRLGREQFQTNLLLKQITDAGCRIFFYIDGREAVLDSATAKFMQAVRNFGSELEREKARQRARDAAERKARQGFVTGGEPYGYQNIHYKDGKEVPRGAPHDYVKRKIKEDEAQVIRSIFRMYEAGFGHVAIAKTMNGHPRYAEQLREFFDERPPAPPSRRSGSWAPTAVREMLYRRLHRGEIVWGQYTGIDRNGRAGLRIKRDPSEWLIIPAEDLRIVPEPLWQAVHKRLEVVNDKYLRDTRGKLWGKPDRGREGGYLLSGLAKCGCCGWNLAVLGGVRRVYGCTHSFRRGVCRNTLAQPVALVDDAFLAALETEVLTPERFRYAVEIAVERVQARLAQEPDRRDSLEGERKGLERRIERWADAIGEDRGIRAVLTGKIKEAQASVEKIKAELGRLELAPKLGVREIKCLEEQVAGELARFSDLLKGNVPRARQALKKLLVDRVTFMPVQAEKGKQTYAFTGELSYGALLRGAIYPDKSPLGTPFLSNALLPPIPAHMAIEGFFQGGIQELAK